MSKKIKYSLSVQTNFHIQNYLSHFNLSNDSFFWQDEFELGKPLYFSSLLLNDINDVEEIYNKASQIISIYEGIYKILDRTRHCNNYFTLENLIDLSNGKILLRFYKPEIYKIDIDFNTIEKKAENTPINPIYILFEEIVEHEFLKNLFFLISNKVDYKMLYIIYDDIRFYLKSIDDPNFLKDYSKELKRFTHTANNYEILGFYARHGRSNMQPPNSPMNLIDSMNLIFDIVVKLLTEKFAIKLPEYWGLSYGRFTDEKINF